MKRWSLAVFGFVALGLLGLMPAAFRADGAEPGGSGGSGASGGWSLAFSDDFSGKTLGPDWLILRGDWHVNAAGQLQIQRQWTSHSFIALTRSFRGQNVRVEFDAMIPAGEQAGPLGVYLQSGVLGWGGGGIDDRVGASFVPASQAGTGRNAGTGVDESKLLTEGQMHHFNLSLIDGHFEIQVDGKQVASGTTPQGRSLLNNGLQFSAVLGAMIDNVKVYTAPMAKPLPAINDATPAQNAKATVFAADFLDPKKPDCGFQEAIDSLPPGGGVVVLPKGEFLMRRFLEVPSHTTLMGQGPETVLKVMDVTAAQVESFSSDAGIHKLVLKGPHDFRAGDAFSYGSCWGHPINAKRPGQKPVPHMLGGGAAPENRLLALAVEGNTLTVNSPPPADKRKGARILHFFPAVCSYETEFAEVKDLTIVGPEKNPGGGAGGFMTNPVTFGVTSNPRFSRLVIRNWPGDGISAQGCDDGRFLDNTISGTSNGMHPGTTTIRVLAARNYSVDNRSGLFFCWYNQQGVYYRNYLKDFTGYPDAGDVFNTIACNRTTEPINLTVGFNGCFFGNQLGGLTIYRGRGDPRALGPGGRTYELPPRYFTFGYNTVPSITLAAYAQGNVIAGNRAPDGTPAKVDDIAAATQPAKQSQKNVVVTDATLAPIAGLPQPITRTTPEPPPSLPEPVLDGRKFYKPDAPDCGFQAALDQLAKTGGTLRLPGGRYALSQALSVPSNVTLTGYGTGTILLPKETVPGLIIVEKASQNVTIRDLTIEGDWRAVVAEFAAVTVMGSQRVSLIALDIRGWDGPGISLNAADSTVRDCRMLRCARPGCLLLAADNARVEGNSAVECNYGFLSKSGRSAVLTGNIAARNAGPGYSLMGTSATLLVGNNASHNGGPGIDVLDCQEMTATGNTSDANNQSAYANGAGIEVGGSTVGARVLFNNCGDEQIYATQLVGIREDPSASKSDIRFNVTATLATRRGHEKEPSLVTQGKDSTVADNWTETILPSNDSLESIAWQQSQKK